MKYIRKRARFSNSTLIKELTFRGYVIALLSPPDRRFDVAFHRPGDPILYLVRHEARNGYAHLVARGDANGALKLIPTCSAHCRGCLKCAVAAEFNGETAAEARKRRREPRTEYRIYSKRTPKGKRGRKLELKKSFSTCATAEVDVHSQAEDID